MIRWMFLAALAAVSSSANAQTGAFVVTLGVDTVAVESFTRSGNLIRGSVLRHTPQTNVVHYVLTLNGDGTVGAYEHRIVRPDGTPMPNGGPLTMLFTGDSIIREIVQNGQRVTLRHAAPRGTLPTIPGSFLQYELVIKAARNGAVGTFGFGAQQQAPTVQEVAFFGTDSAEIIARTPASGPANPGLVLRTGFRLDANNNVVRSDGSLTTQKFLVARVPHVDVIAIGSAWAARDAAGQAMGAASTRDTVRATIGAAQIMVDYGRPAKRGREIWGVVVPYDTTWRLGANAATQFRTDRDLDIGGVHVPAGFYTLWLLPTSRAAWLIVNKQTGQWGTVYDRSQDIARIPLELHMDLPAVEERFRIFVQGDMLMMHWDRGGYGVKITAR